MRSLSPKLSLFFFNSLKIKTGKPITQMTIIGPQMRNTSVMCYDSQQVIEKSIDNRRVPSMSTQLNMSKVELTIVG